MIPSNRRIEAILSSVWRPKLHYDLLNMMFSGTGLRKFTNWPTWPSALRCGLQFVGILANSRPNMMVSWSGTGKMKEKGQFWKHLDLHS